LGLGSKRSCVLGGAHALCVNDLGFDEKNIPGRPEATCDENMIVESFLVSCGKTSDIISSSSRITGATVHLLGAAAGMHLSRLSQLSGHADPR